LQGGGFALAVLVPEEEQDWRPRSPPAEAIRGMLPNHAYSGGEHFVPFCSSTGSGRGRSTPFLTNRDTDAG